MQLQHEQQQETQPCPAQATSLSPYDTSHNKYIMVAICRRLPPMWPLRNAQAGGGGCCLSFALPPHICQFQPRWFGHRDWTSARWRMLISVSPWRPPNELPAAGSSVWVRRCIFSGSWLASPRDAAANGGAQGQDESRCARLVYYFHVLQMIKCSRCLVHDILSCVVSHSTPWPCLIAVVIVDVIVVVVVDVSGQHNSPSFAGRAKIIISFPSPVDINNKQYSQGSIRALYLNDRLLDP